MEAPKIKTRLMQILRSPLLPFSVLLLFLLVAHLHFTLVDGDEVYYGNIIGQMSLWEFSVKHYTTWSSRTLIELVLSLVSVLPRLVWRLANPLVATGTVLCISHMIGAEKNTRVNWLLCGLMLLYPWPLMATAGWVATTVVYMWPGCAAMLALLPAAKLMRGQRPKAVLWAVALVLTLFAANMEQVTVLLLPAFFAYIVYLWTTRQRVHPVLYMQLALCVANLVYALCSPGVTARFEIESTSWFQNFGMRSVFSNLELGISSALNPLIYGRDYIFDFFCLVLALLVWQRNKNVVYRLLGLFPLGMSLLFSYAMRFLPFMAFFTEALGGEGIITLQNGRSISAYLPMLLLYVIFIVCLADVYLALGHTPVALAAVVALVCGLLTRVAVGFSPTIWTSGARTGYFFCLTIIGVSGLLLCHLDWNKLWKNALLYAYIALFSVAQSVSILRM